MKVELIYKFIREKLKPILWSIGTISIIVSSVIFQYSIAEYDNDIEEIDFKISKLNDDIEIINFQFNENKVLYAQLTDTVYTIEILSNFPQNEKLNSSIVIYTYITYHK